MMGQIPADGSVDSTLALVREGYRFIINRCQRLQSDVIQTRLLFQPVICMAGAEAAKVFYDNDRFLRRGSAPARLQKTLFGKGGVQGLDDAAHRWRKQMFLALMTPAAIQRLADLTAAQWSHAIVRWEGKRRVILFDELQELLCRAVCQWAGVPLAEAEVAQRTRDLAALIESGGRIGPRYWQGRAARARSERWASDIIERIRSGTLHVPEESAAHRIASYRNLDGTPLETRVAAVELINVLRPTVAVARYIVFAAVALHEHPHWRQQLHTDADQELFVQEVRRYYPFFPFVAARVRSTFEWRGYRFPKGRRVLLDLYGTNHDGQVWEQPDVFRPERFRTWDGSAYNFISQGGGEHLRHHRCPGEWLTIALMKVGLRALTTRMTYEVPRQDLRVSLTSIPTLPRSRFVIRKVRHRPSAAEARRM